jgi:formate hydrogenlyase subunit 6/NADH:ubiquinone oxidoreductase subunit I
MGSYISRIVTSAASILEGMAITLSWLFRRPCTVQWPDKIEKPIEATLSDRYRGILEVETKTCTACQMCEKTCPIGCILITVERNAETKERLITGFDIDAAKCMYCGLCAEACPTGAIRHTTQFAGATPQIGRLVLRYIGAGEKLTPYKPKTEVADLAPRGSLAAAQLQRCFPEGDRGAK